MFYMGQPRSCPTCEKVFTPIRQRKFCSVHCYDSSRIRKQYKQRKQDQLCTACGVVYVGNIQRLICDGCWAIHKPISNKSNRVGHLKRRYGLSLEEYRKMMDAQGGVCKICGKPPKGKWFRNLDVDHSHQTGEIRGLLCNPCNTKLGWYERYPIQIKDYLNADN